MSAEALQPATPAGSPDPMSTAAAAAGGSPEPPQGPQGPKPPEGGGSIWANIKGIASDIKTRAGNFVNFVDDLFTTGTKNPGPQGIAATIGSSIADVFKGVAIPPAETIWKIAKNTGGGVQALIETAMLPFRPINTLIHPIASIAKPAKIGTNLAEATAHMAEALPNSVDGIGEGGGNVSKRWAHKIPGFKTIGNTFGKGLDYVTSIPKKVVDFCTLPPHLTHKWVKSL